MPTLRVNSGTGKQKTASKAVSAGASLLTERDIFPQLECAKAKFIFAFLGAVLNSVNAAFGYCFQTARSSAVTVSHPNLNI
jgi:hypothetical protein